MRLWCRKQKRPMKRQPCESCVEPPRPGVQRLLNEFYTRRFRLSHAY